MNNDVTNAPSATAIHAQPKERRLRRETITAFPLVVCATRNRRMGGYGGKPSPVSLCSFSGCSRLHRHRLIRHFAKHLRRVEGFHPGRRQIEAPRVVEAHRVLDLEASF